jgi:hypothetical protein
MPLKMFICPDGERVNCEDCIALCRQHRRCASLATLRAIWESERQWDGTPHVTDLLNGPMMTMLKVTRDYAVVPSSRAYALLGSTHHKLMEKSSDYPAEMKVEVMGIQGTVDSLEPAGNGLWHVVDFKTWGSYRVARALGMEERGKKPDPSGATYSRGGAWGKAGTPKMVKVWAANPLKAELENEKIQLNFYRIGVETKGMSVAKMMIQATVRDGNTVTARGYGIDDPVYMIEVPAVDDIELMVELMHRREELEGALASGAARFCNDAECWGGRRCNGYCDVWEWCVRGVEQHGGA